MLGLLLLRGFNVKVEPFTSQDVTMTTSRHHWHHTPDSDVYLETIRTFVCLGINPT